MIYLLRHGERKNQSNDSTEIEKWKKSKRYKQNNYDVPLSNNGKKMCKSKITKILQKQITDKTKIGYIYTSPYTRCVETAIEFQKTINELYDIKILIRIEYGIISNFFGGVDSLYFNNGNTTDIKFINNKVVIKKPVAYIDEYMENENIFKRFSKSNFDTKYVSYKSLNDINKEYLESPQTICNNRIDSFLNLKNIFKQDEFNLIVSHGEILSLIYGWINNEWNSNKGFELCGGMELKISNKKYKINQMI
jgi:broad specificity phosphatase PhoE